MNVGTPARTTSMPPFGTAAAACAAGLAGGALSRRLEPYRVLIVDDNVDACEGLAMLIDLAGYEVEMCFDGATALRVAERMMPDAVLLDISMPLVSGYEVARALRGRPAQRDTLLIALTGLGTPSDVARALAAGFDYHRVKPVDIDELLQLLADELGHRD